MTAISQPAGEHALLRRIDWKKTFWIASGVPPLVLFSIGGIAATVGTPSYIVWTLSILMGFIQSFTYAEIAGMFPNKSGGAPIYGAAAWIHYGKIFGPLSVWSYWLAWSPVLSIGTGIAALSPTLFGALIATHSKTNVNYGYILGAALMIAAGLVAVFLAVAAERKSLEDVAKPLTVSRAKRSAGAVPARAN